VAEAVPSTLLTALTETLGETCATTNVACCEPATKFVSAASDASSVTDPAPVRVTVDPVMVAGPLTTLYVNAPVELELAETVNGALPYV
jgi:hypothetical protein